ncbi:MAG: hypothetical protein AAF828_11205 [Bacteroidota bacterium]
MKVLLSLLPLLIFFTACSEDDGVVLATYDGDIFVRIANETNVAFDETTLWFFDPDQPREYLAIASGTTTDYLAFPAAGSCDINFRATLTDATDTTLDFTSVCLCICLLSPGYYTLTVNPYPGTTSFAITITED